MVHSTLAAETLALVEGLDVAITIQEMIQENCGARLNIKAYSDNIFMLESVKSLKNVSEKRLRLDIGYIRETVEKNSVELFFISSNDQIADVSTKYNKNLVEKFKKKVLVCPQQKEN